MNVKNQRGFTLIELLTVIGIISVLASLAIMGFTLYRANAGYAVVERIITDSRTGVEGAVLNSDALPAAVTLVNQRSPGPLANPSAHALVPAIQIPNGISYTVSFDPTCQDGGCQSALIEARHQYGKNYQQWVRFGDGLSLSVEYAGSGW